MDKRTRTSLSSLFTTFRAGEFIHRPTSKGAILRGFPNAGNAGKAARVTSRNWAAMVKAGAVVLVDANLQSYRIADTHASLLDYWSQSVSASVLEDYRTGNVRTIWAG